MFELIGMLLGKVLSLNISILLIILIVGIFIAFKLFQYLLRVVFTGICFALIPIIAYFIGLGGLIPLSLSNVVNFALLGILACFAYTTLKTGYKVINVVLSPFKRLSKPKQQTVVVKTVKEED